MITTISTEQELEANLRWIDDLLTTAQLLLDKGDLASYEYYFGAAERHQALLEKDLSS